MATMNSVFWLPLFRHCQGEAHTHLIVTSKGKTAREGKGLGFWFNPVGTAISEVPVNDQSVAVTFKARSTDFQEVNIGAQVWYKVTDPSTIATRFDFSINTETGAFNSDPLTSIQGALTSAAQEAVWSHVASYELETLLQSELSGLSGAVSKALSSLEFGITVTRAVVTGVRPARNVEQALQAKTLERLQMEADAASFERRAKATEQERAIQEAELANNLALAQQREDLIKQNTANARAEAESAAGVQRVQATAQAESSRIQSEQNLSNRKADDTHKLAHQTQLDSLRAADLRTCLALFSTNEAAANAMTLNKLPDTLGNLQVLTLGEGGVQAALARLGLLAENH